MKAKHPFKKMAVNDKLEMEGTVSKVKSLVNWYIIKYGWRFLVVPGAEGMVRVTRYK